MGYHNVVLHDGFLHDKRRKYRDPLEYDDYLPELRRVLGPEADISDDGPGCNGYATRCCPWDERLHPTSWVTSKSIEFLRRRDPTKPFFLKVSYHRPHTPLDPPPSYWDMYEHRPLPEPYNGDWCDFMFNSPNPENPVPLEPHFRDRARRAYCALVTQIDFELNRLFIALGDLGLWDEALILLVSDHGDMLYDHRLVRKSMPFEGCTAIPLLFRLPQSQRQNRQMITDNRLAELRDIYPTICALCGVEIPPGLDGQSLFSRKFRRDYLHGEHPNGLLSNHWLTDGNEKYCWFSQSGRELLFDLTVDPNELHNLAPEQPERTAFRRHQLMTELRHRPEGYVSGNVLHTGCIPRASLPWAGYGPATVK
ncbi:MAG: sulfatase-like hydrolase/transferase [Victivallales bacterium]|nr:sulfatase-like hydrolase/transferase [Victivallales bacterium]